MTESIGIGTPRLVCLHIPKTAGSSLRETIKVVYGPERMHWFNEDDGILGRQRFKESAVADKLFLGGHRPLNFYPAGAVHLYFAALRHPLERARSLFSYFTRPEEGGSEGNIAERQRLKEQWVRQGIVPQSLLRSIERCKPFREAIHNEQCRYLSRGAATLEAALETLAGGNFLIGNSTHLGSLLDTLGTTFHWPETREVRTNISVSSGEDDILSEPGVIEKILEYGAEDMKLYDYVQQQHGGLYCNMPDREMLLDSALRFTDARRRALSDLAWRKIELSPVDPQESVRLGRTSFKLCVRNGSREILNPECENRIAISYMFLDEHGEVIKRDTPRTLLETVLGPGESVEVPVKLVVPEDLPRSPAGVRFSVMVENRFWLFRSCPDHALDIPVMPALSDSTVVGQRALSDLAWRKIELSPVDPGERVRQGRTFFNLRICNRSREFLNPEYEDRIAISYKLLDEQGKIIERDTPRSLLETVVGPGESVEVPVKLFIPDDLPRSPASVRFSVMVEKKFWLFRICPEHALDIPVVFASNGSAAV